MQSISIVLDTLVSREQVRLQCALKDTIAYSSTGSEFQTVGPLTEKAHRPSVLRRYLANTQHVYV